MPLENMSEVSPVVVIDGTSGCTRTSTSGGGTVAAKLAVGARNAAARTGVDGWLHHDLVPWHGGQRGRGPLPHPHERRRHDRDTRLGQVDE